LVRRIVAFVIVLVVVGLPVSGWFVADMSLHPSHSPVPYTVAVVSLHGDRIELRRTHDSSAPGVYRLEWTTGSAQISDVLARPGSDVVRRIDHIQGTPPAAGTKARIDDLYVGDPGHAFALPFQDVNVPGPAGNLPAWVVPGTSSTWAILLHGYSGTRGDMLYLVPALRALSTPLMLVSYRNDPGAGHGSHGFTEFGQAEWHDVDAAVAYARAHGATGIVLAGASMGGSVTSEFLRHSTQASIVRAVVLDAPGLDLRSDMHYGARPHGLHGVLNWAVINAGQLVMRLRAGIDFSDLDQLAHARAFHVPILIFHGAADDTVWIGHSRRLAQERPDLVSLATFPQAGHVESWNVDRTRYEAILTAFLRRALA
jgi:pimeloyl-ACP methyl ester carboxylesterase